MLIDTTYRSQELEIMDDLDMDGSILIDTLDKIANINKWLGGNQLTLNGVKELLTKCDKTKNITIVDLGCGNGDMLRMLADYGNRENYQLSLIGIDANKATINYGIKLSEDYNNISFKQLDVEGEEFDKLEYDIALSTLFLHHFTSDKIAGMINKWANRAKIGIVINDLHRHRLAYYLFKIVTLFYGNYMVKNDGLASILKGFKRTELDNFAKNISFKSTIHWRWAFRYQWIINKQ